VVDQKEAFNWAFISTSSYTDAEKRNLIHGPMFGQPHQRRQRTSNNECPIAASRRRMQIPRGPQRTGRDSQKQQFSPALLELFLRFYLSLR
jgi:hypothetical protein